MNLSRLLCANVVRSIARRGFRQSCINREPLRPLLMAALSPTMEKGNIVVWNFKEGDLMESGSTICDIETDKAVVGFDTIDDAILVKIVKPPGSRDVPLGALIGWVADKGDDISKLEVPSEYSAPAETPSTAEADIPEEVEPKTEDKEETSTPREKIRASPAVRALIIKHNIDTSKLKPSGPGGSITRSDVEVYLSTPNAGKTDKPSSDSLDVAVDTIRGIVASRLSLSKRTITHEYCSINCSTDAIDARRAELKESGIKISVNDFIIKAVALSLKLVPELNGVADNNKTILKKSIDVAVAVSIPDGLITPVVRNADTRSLENLSKCIKELAARARDRKLSPEEFQGSSFTVSNLGMYGVDAFAAVINPPELGILAVGASREWGCSNCKRSMNVTLSYNASCVTPTTAAKFLGYFKGFIESPLILDIGT